MASITDDVKEIAKKVANEWVEGGDELEVELEDIAQRVNDADDTVRELSKTLSKFLDDAEEWLSESVVEQLRKIETGLDDLSTVLY